MARRIKISSSVLNIRLHPHPIGVYGDFFQDIFRLRQIVRLHGDRHGMLSLLNLNDIDQGSISGTITTFVNIEVDGDWFDAVNLTEATDNQISKVSIPENLHPNSAQYYFYFDVKQHKLYVQNYSKGKILTPNQALTLFGSLSKNINITQKYNLASINLVQSKSALDKLFKIDRIDRIIVSILKPNSDILADDFEAQIEEHLANSHARSVTVAYQADPGQSLVPVEDIKTISNAALENGNVEVIGRNNGLRVHESTEDNPLILQNKYDPDHTSEAQAFKHLVNEHKG
ncbi:MAG: DUF4747 family protein [Hoeflea sp.]|uniref:DUF4747 family protein n=1 Tax=Hoeflea sp. TaxID=1940281 RepID=UPI001D9B81A2|nr:DUF4747 family protein [Hoeflea sp.]MBU4530953.1 DUF4747 family protein [Alphaproteobacteria bacterium]MBU4542728.1 DUF4747 family protein [Alphaproteobacteria bacterium]MBU4549345.1 DUF4747 family protein [Alphaproteobacteria bacterium]MBV1722845.1 DUF4747 family protein [Hoeflea sp.]MBV1761567.1 DUF4747 family protein [Hoeflea sp.]